MNTLAIIGLGGVGRALLTQAAPHFRIVLLADSGGYVLGDLDEPTWSRIAHDKAAGTPLASQAEGQSGDWRAALPEGALIADLTAEPAGDRLAELVVAGHRIALANKKPLCGSFFQFRAITGGGATRYEATVGAGLPVIMTSLMLRDSGDQLLSIEGCFSGTLGFLCTAIEAGEPFSLSVMEARRRGWTEPDPRDDLGGVDVARKALILGRTFGFTWELSDIAVEPLYPAELAGLGVDAFMRALPALDAALAARQASAAAKGRTLRYVASVTPEGASVGLREVERDSPLGALRGPDNLICWTTRHYQERPLVVRGPGAGVEVTASAVLHDLLCLRG